MKLFSARHERIGGRLRGCPRHITLALGFLAAGFQWVAPAPGWAAGPKAADTHVRDTASLSAGLDRKIQLLSEPASRPPSSLDPIVISDDEATAYLRQHGPEFFPPGVQAPELRIRADGVVGAADVDFDRLNQSQGKSEDLSAQAVSWFFKGKQRVTVRGKLTTGGGQGKVVVEDVKVGDTAIPDWLVQWVLQNYLQKRYAVDMSKPFILPDHVTRIDLSQGQATFVRSASKVQ